MEAATPADTIHAHCRKTLQCSNDEQLGGTSPSAEGPLSSTASGTSRADSATQPTKTVLWRNIDRRRTSKQVDYQAGYQLVRRTMCKQAGARALVSERRPILARVGRIR